MKKIIAYTCLGMSLASVAKGEISNNSWLAEKPFEANFTAVTDYISKGLSQTLGRPAIQAGLQGNAAIGVYAGFWGSHVSRDYYPNGNGVEVDGILGFKKDIKDVNLRLELKEEWYPGAYANVPQRTKFTTTELMGRVGYKRVFASLSYFITDWFGLNNDTAHSDFSRRGHSKGTIFVEGGYEHPITDKLKLALTVGYLSMKNYNPMSYTTYGTTLSYDAGQFIKGLTLGVSGVYTDARRKYHQVVTPTNHFRNPIAKQFVGFASFSL